MISPDRTTRVVVELRYKLPLTARDLNDICRQAQQEFDPSEQGFDDRYWVRSDGETLILSKEAP